MDTSAPTQPELFGSDEYPLPPEPPTFIPMDPPLLRESVHPNPDGKPRLLAVDLPNVLSRSWYAQASIGGADGTWKHPLSDDSGRPAQAIGGLIRSIKRVMSLEGATHILVAVDSPNSFRKAAAAHYKGTRKERPSDLIRQEIAATALLRSLGWPVIGLDTFEADDVLATAATVFEGSVCVLSGDKDLIALVDDRVSVRLLRNQEDKVCTPATASDCFGKEIVVLPEWVTDFKALAGDPSDGIPGVAGIGAKGAAKLLGEYKNLNNIYAHIDEIPSESLRKKLTVGFDAAYESQHLATLVRNLPLPEGAWKESKGLFSKSIANRVEEKGYKRIRGLFTVEEAPFPEVGF